MTLVTSTKFNAGMKSSLSAEWETPPEVFDPLNGIWRFTLDAAASHTNHKVDRYFTKEDNSLARDWAGHRVWLNPPYGREIIHWVMKAAAEGNKSGTVVVALLPGRIDTGWWDIVETHAAVWKRIKGRVRFIDQSGQRMQGAPFPSVIAIFGWIADVLPGRAH